MSRYRRLANTFLVLGTLFLIGELSHVSTMWPSPIINGLDIAFVGSAAAAFSVAFWALGRAHEHEHGLGIKVRQLSRNPR